MVWYHLFEINFYNITLDFVIKNIINGLLYNVIFPDIVIFLQ
jgi:hypothetical protein